MTCNLYATELTRLLDIDTTRTHAHRELVGPAEESPRLQYHVLYLLQLENSCMMYDVFVCVEYG